MTAVARVTLGALLMLLLVSTGCGGGAGDTTARRRAVARTTTTADVPEPPTTRPADIVPAPQPPNVPDPRVAWYHHPAAPGTQVLLGVVRSALPGPHPAVVLAPGSDGFNSDYVKFAEELAARGLDVGFGCWWANLPDPSDTPESLRILCTEAPLFKGIIDEAVPDLDSLVEGVEHALGEPRDVAVLGFSRGGGIVALRASAGRPEAVIGVAGVYEGWTNIGSVPGEVDVVARAASIQVPVLILHGADDNAVPVVQAEHLEAALRSAGADVEAHYYAGESHGLAQVPSVRADLVERVRSFLCQRYACGPA